MIEGIEKQKNNTNEESILEMLRDVYTAGDHIYYINEVTHKKELIG